MRKKATVIGSILFAVLLMAASYIDGANRATKNRDEYWKQELIKRDLAGHNEKTGIWEWKE